MPLEFKETKQDKTFKRKIKIAAVVGAVFFSFILARLCYLQIIKGTKYTELSTNNRIRHSTLPAPRGHIFSSDNQALVDTVPAFDLILIPQDAINVNAVLIDISDMLSINREHLESLVKSRKGRPSFEPIPLKKNLTWDEMSVVLSKKLDLPGININVVPNRRYISFAPAPHVLGFLGEAEPLDLTRPILPPYKRGDLVGKYGLERLEEQRLRGINGLLQTEVDALGKRKQILAKIAPRAGKNIKTTLISSVQQAAHQALIDKAGAIIALDPRNGNILALASAPCFDPNLFSRGINSADWQHFSSHPLHPLLNRAIQSQQPPGSIFKIVLLAAALEEKIVSPADTFFCPGYFVLGNRRFHCWKREGHGHMNMKDALVNSCDTYFYNLALKLGIDTIVRYAELLGFGLPTGIELPGEKTGLLPSPGWLWRKQKARWQQGDTLNLSIGQGFLLTTPLQMAVIYAGITQHGKVYRPNILLEANNKTEENPMLREYQLSDQTFCFLKEALHDVVHAPRGTGYNSRIPGHEIAGKTGTAQVVSLSKKPPKGQPVPRHMENHAWFVAFSPVEKPEIVVCVFLEHGGGGGRDAAPLAKEVLQAYFKHKKLFEGRVLLN
jgi:penicillin-binding protein 2